MISSEDIAGKFNLIHHGNSKNITNVGSIANQGEQILTWASKSDFGIKVNVGVLLLSKSEFAKIPANNQVTYLITNDSPRLVFALIFHQFFSHLKPDYFGNYASEHYKNPNIKIGERVFIGKDVEIGDGTEIQHNSSIFSGTKIGRNCRISTNVTIGSAGLGFEYYGDSMIEFPQIGNVLVGDHVNIGENTSIRRASLDSTIIGNHTKIGTSCNIGHNCKIGDLSILTAHISMGGSSEIGRKCFIGMNVTVRNKVKIGNNVTIAMGASVIGDFMDDVTIAGIPARILK